jgi:COMPASS component SWD3
MFTPSSLYIMSATLSSTIRIYSLNTGKVLKTLRASEYVSERFPCHASVFAGHKIAANGHDGMDIDEEDGKRPAWVVAGSENGKAVIWDLQDRRVIAVLSGHSAPVVAVAVSPDGKTIATGALEPDCSIKLWRA